MKTLARYRGLGFGVATMDDRSAIVFVMEGRDLAFHAQPPPREALKPGVRVLLGQALDKFDRGDWRDAFEDGCTALEEQCRKYLIKHHKLRPVNLFSSEIVKVKTPTAKQITEMPLGALKDIFCGKVSQTPAEARLCAALESLNQDRIKKVHRPSERRTESGLRKRAGSHIWTISNALELIVD